MVGAGGKTGALTKRFRMPRETRNSGHDNKKKRPVYYGAFVYRYFWNLKHVPQILVVNLVMELNLLRLDERSQGARAAIG